MRSPCWCSALAVAALALAGCGGGSSHRAASYSYDTAAPLHVRVGARVAGSASVAVHDASFLGANGTRVRAFVAEPSSGGRRHEGVLLLHGSGGTRLDLLLPAAELAQRGVVAMTISSPNDAPTYRPLVVDARRALDVLQRRLARPRRLGVVGYSLGAQTAAIVAGVDPRPVAFAIVAGRGTPRARQFVARTHARLLFVGGTNDERVPEAQLVALARAAPGDQSVRWYPTTHAMSVQVFDDVVQWEARELRRP
jgi:dienelactone hydrolase